MQPSNSTQITSNYDMFRFLGANRQVSRAHVNELARSMEENGNFTESQPILVNENMEVIDGQHRLEACRQLNLPVHYTMMPGLTVNEARTMNLLHRRWNSLDFLHSYAEQALRPYLELQRLRQEFDHVKSISLIILYARGAYEHGYNAEFRKGEFEMFDYAAATDRLNKLSEFMALSDAFKVKSMGVALLAVMNSPFYDHRRMVEKITQFQADVRAFQNVSDNIRELENFFNEGRRASNKVRFF